MTRDFRDHIAHTPKYTARADDLTALADEARAAAATYTWEFCPSCGQPDGCHLVVCPTLEELPRCAFPPDDDPGGFK